MAELKVTTILDRTGFNKGVEDLKTSIKELENQKINIKVEGNFEKITGSVAKVVAAQEKTKQVSIQAAAAIRTAELQVQTAVEKTTQAREKAAQAATSNVAALATAQEKTRQEEQKTAQAIEKTAQAREKTVQAEQKTQQETQKTAQAIERTTQAHEKTQQAALRAATEATKGARQAANATNNLADSVTRVSEAFAGWAQRRIWMSLYNGLRQSLSTMKEIDSYLTTIQRVSGVSSAVTDQYAQQAYEISRQYGVKPADYLSNVVDFTRAGYGELAPALAEAATKLQVVGEVSADVATQMMLATDAAYGFEGSTEKMSAVIDGVVAIGDNYATTIEKIAEGIGIVAPIAAQAHVSIDELSAAIGTITADTQRSGTEAARALRYVILNILGQVGEEVEDGVELTEEEVKGLSDVLNYYLSDRLKELQESGQVINPFEVLGALAQGVKDGLINESELFDSLTQIAGKLRSSQIMALVSDWDKYSDMVTLFGDSVGETDAKVDIALTSWNAKANMLSASFTQLFSSVLNSSMVKGGLTALTSFVDLLNVFDGAPAKILAIASAFSVMVKVVENIATGGKIAQFFSFFTNPTFLAAAGVTAAVMGIVKLYDVLTDTQEELDEKAKTASQEYETQKAELAGITTELESHRQIIAELEGRSGSLTAEEEARLAKEKEITAELEAQLRAQQYKTDKAELEAAYTAAKAGLAGKIDLSGRSFAENDLLGVEGLLDALLAQTTGSSLGGNLAQRLSVYLPFLERVEDAKKAVLDSSAEEYDELTEFYRDLEILSEGLQEELTAYYLKQTGYYDQVLKIAESRELFSKDLLTTEEQTIIDYITYYRELIGAYQKYMPELFGGGTTGSEGETSGAAGAVSVDENAETQSEYAAAVENTAKQVAALTAAMQEYNATGKISRDTYKALTEAGFNLEDSVMEDGDAFIVASGQLDTLKKSVVEFAKKWGIDLPKAFTDAGQSVSSTLQDIIKDAQGMTDEISAAAKALSDFQSQLKSSGEVGDTLLNYRKAYESAMKMWESGYYGSTEFQGFASLVLGDNVMQQLGYDFQKAGQLLGGEFFKAMFSPENSGDYGVEALKYLAQMQESFRYDENGNLLYGFTAEDGQVAAVVNDFDALAETLGINVDVLMTLFEALGIYKNELNTTRDDVVSLVDAMGDLSVSADKVSEGTQDNAIDVDKFINRLAAEGKSVSEIYQLLNAVRDTGEYELFGDTGKTQETIERINQAVSDANNVEKAFDIDTGSFVTKMAVVEEAIATAQSAIDTFNGTGLEEKETSVTVDTADLESATSEVEAFDEVTGTATAYVDNSGAEAGVSRVEEIAGYLTETFGAIDEEAKAGIKTSLATPEAALALATLILNAFGAIDEDAEAGVDTSGITSGLPDVEAAQETLAGYGIEYSAIASLLNEVTPSEREKISAMALELAIYGTAYNAVATLDSSDLSDGEKQAAIQEAQETVSRFDGEYNAIAVLNDDAVDGEGQSNIKNTKALLDAFDATYTAIIAINTSALDDDEKVGKVGGLKESLGEISKTWTATVGIKPNASMSALTTVSQALGSISEGADAPVSATDNGATELISSIQEDLDKLGEGVVIPISVGDPSNPKRGSGVITNGEFDKSAIDTVAEVLGSSFAESIREVFSTAELFIPLEEYAETVFDDVLTDIDFGDSSWVDTFEDVVGGALDSWLEAITLTEEDFDAIARDAGSGPEEVTRLAGQLIDLSIKTALNEASDATDQLLSGVADSAAEVFNALAENWSYGILPSAGESEEEIEALLASMEAMGEIIPTVEVDASSAEIAENAVDELTSSIEAIPDSKTITITVVETLGRSEWYGSGGGGVNATMTRAEGDRNFPGGISLVNEKGPELISANGRAFVANGGYPGLVSLPRGSVIFTADETRSILNGGSVPAFAEGTATVNGKRRKIDIVNDMLANGGTWGIVLPEDTGDTEEKPKPPSNPTPTVDNTDYWAIVEAHYNEIIAVADNATTNLKYQISLLQDAWDDEKKPLDDQIDALNELNDIISRQITLLTRERDKLTAPIQAEVDALKEAKEIQDDELELEEKQKSVEEARAELQNAQNERTIRFYNKETGHWEWMADQSRIQSAQEALEKAEKSLSDFEYELRIKELENQISDIEEDYQAKIDLLNADKLENEDAIYDLQQTLKDIERKYEALIEPLEEREEDTERAKAAAQNVWTNATFARRDAVEGDLATAVSKTGTPGSQVGSAISELTADLSTIASAYKQYSLNNTLTSLGIQFGATPSYTGTSGVATIGGTSMDSHDIIINGLTLPASAAYQSLIDLANDLSIYANY